MKLNGLIGTGSGKLGSSVFAVRAGQQIVRQYQPIVLNPKTEGQVLQRARFKAAVQSAVVYRDSSVFTAVKGRSVANMQASAILKSDAITAPTQVGMEGEITVNPLLVPITGGSDALPIGTSQINIQESPYAYWGMNLFGLSGYDVVHTDVYMFFQASATLARILSREDPVNASGNMTFGSEDISAWYREGQSGNVFIYYYGIRFTSSTTRTEYEKLVAQYDNGVNLALSYLREHVNAGLTVSASRCIQPEEII